MKKVILAVVLLFSSTFVYATGTCQDILVPAYFYPSQWQSTPWDTMASTHSPNQFVIMNPASGPGTSSNADYVAEVAQAQAAGLLVLGYISTNYGQRSSSTIDTEVNKYHDWYSVDGIFFDEVATGTNQLSYYQARLDHVFNEMPRTDVVLNPGTHPNEGYAQLDVPNGSQLTIITFEGQYSDYISLSVPSWVNNYNGKMFAHLVYNTPSGNMQNAVNLSNERNVGYIYVTDDYLSGTAPNQYLNPWDTLASYNSTLVSATSCK